MTDYKRYRVLIWVAFFALIFTARASAGFLESLNNVTKKMEAYNAKQGNSGGNTSSPVRVGGGATDLSYLKKSNECLDPLKGYRSKVAADLIENKLKTQNLAPDLREKLDQDLKSLRIAEAKGSDPESSRYLMDITPEEQMQINAEYTRFYGEITDKCMGKDHMGVGHRTETQYVQNNPLAGSLKGPSSSQVFNDCMEQTKGLRWKVIAEKMEMKLAQTPNLSEQERAAWKADIAAVQEAGEKNLMMPATVDPANPARYMMRLTMEEQMAVNQDYAARSQEIMSACGDAGKKVNQEQFQAADGARRGNGLVDYTNAAVKSGQRQGQPKQAAPVFTGSTAGGSLSHALGATKLDYMDKTRDCYEPLKGHLMKITAEKLQSKLNEQENLSPEKRREWEEDIAAHFDAAARYADRIEPVDPSNPYRHDAYLTRQEWQELNSQHAAFVNEITSACNAKQHLR